MKRLLPLLLLPALTLLSGCVVAPARPYYGRAYYAPPPPPPVVYSRPYYGGYGWRRW
ncbi:hypothetical protein JMJ55_21585 [Belnapia sp. T6]|uniref:Lipoprotein n=1 Tax=Belnapia mucosa TaxID=2804532 RepID=A0ABS1V8D6_9PROT|nr:hypothetical protein [Belnapia mucosa]MBL6457931.1 hypothetical protein [Belnapia mucosa]